MTASEAIEMAKQHSGEIDGSWSAESSVAKRRRVWPFPPFWRVVLRNKNGHLTFTLNVYERTREVRPIRRAWSADTPAPVQPRLVLLFAIKLIVSGVLVWLADHYLGGRPSWSATLVAIPGSFAGVVFFEYLVTRIRSRNNEDEGDGS